MVGYLASMLSVILIHGIIFHMFVIIVILLCLISFLNSAFSNLQFVLGGHQRQVDHRRFVRIHSRQLHRVRASHRAVEQLTLMLKT